MGLELPGPGAPWAGGPCSGGDVCHTCRLGAVFGASKCLFLERSRWRTEGPAEVGRVCFAPFKGLLKAHFPLKNQLPLARRPSCVIA